MSPADLRASLDAMGWDQRGLARHLGIAHNTVNRWALGRYPVPPHVAAWLEQAVAFMQEHPPPSGLVSPPPRARPTQSAPADCP